MIEAVLDRTRLGGVTQEEMEQAVNKAVAGCIMQSERPSNRLFGLGSRWLTCNEYFSTDDLLARFRGLDVDAVNQAAKTYLGRESTDVLAAPDAETAPTE